MTSESVGQSSNQAGANGAIGASPLTCFPSVTCSDSETDVALHLPVCGEAVQGHHRAGSEGSQWPPGLILLQQDRHGQQGESHCLTMVGESP